MTTFPNCKPIDMDLLEAAMEDSDLTHTSFLHTLTGEVLFLSEYQDADEREQLLAEIDGSSHYRRIERIPSSQAYQWMVDFVEEVVAPRDKRVASKLSSALNGKGAFSRFKHALYHSDNQWVQAWYAWKQQRLAEAAETWLQEEL